MDLSISHKCLMFSTWNIYTKSCFFLHLMKYFNVTCVEKLSLLMCKFVLLFKINCHQIPKVLWNSSMCSDLQLLPWKLLNGHKSNDWLDYVSHSFAFLCCKMSFLKKPSFFVFRFLFRMSQNISPVTYSIRFATMCSKTAPHHNAPTSRLQTLCRAISSPDIVIVTTSK